MWLYLLTGTSEQIKIMHGEVGVMYDAVKFIYSSFFYSCRVVTCLSWFCHLYNAQAISS